MQPLFTTISMRGGERIVGIVDYVTHKHVYLYDTRDDNNMLLVTLATLWQMTAPDKRFSHFCLSSFPNVDLPKIRLLPKFAVESSSHDLSVKKKRRVVRRKLKLNKPAGV